MNATLAPREGILLNAMIVTIGVITVAAGIYFAAIDRPLITAAVCLGALVPVSLLLVALNRVSPPASDAHRRRRQRASSVVIAAAGLAATVAGALLLLSPLSTLAAVLLSMGPGTMLGGLTAYGVIRRESAAA